MKQRQMHLVVIFFLPLFTCIVMAANGCGPKNPKPVKIGGIPDDEVDPAEWGKVYPLHYQSWLRTREPRQRWKSRYKRGLDTDRTVYDKLSEYPFMALLFNGWGFGVEYNEPQGHWYMRIDQDVIDPARTEAGGVCLNCKSPYLGALVKKHGPSFYSMPWQDAISALPPKHKDLGAACIDCHDNRTLGLRTRREAFTRGFAKLKKNECTHQEMRILVCAQCHVTYNVPKGMGMKSVGLDHPWDRSTWGNIAVENMIAAVRKNAAYLEWKQNVTGFKLAFFRHPEFEFYTRQGVHFNAGVACADCHMPNRKVGENEITDHDIMSPLKNDLRACVNCHPQSEQRLKAKVYATQDATVSLLLRAGYQAATAAKLFETAHSGERAGRRMDRALYDRAKDYYLEALYRVIYMGAENSLGFHNPAEAGRILGDSIAFSTKAEGLLRQGLSAAGLQVPQDIPLQLLVYLNGRGTRKLNFNREQEFTDPFGTQDRLIPKSAKGL